MKAKEKVVISPAVYYDNKGFFVAKRNGLFAERAPEGIRWNKERFKDNGQDDIQCIGTPETWELYFEIMYKELTDEERQYPMPQKDGIETLYPDGTRLAGDWNTRLTQWEEKNLHRIPKGC